MMNISEKIVDFIFNIYTICLLGSVGVFLLISASIDKSNETRAREKEQALYCLDRAMVVATINDIAVCVPLEVVEKIK
jgi:hypothetical protein